MRDSHDNSLPLDPEMLAVLVETLARVDELSARRARALQQRPSRGSRARADLRVAEGQYVGVFASQALAFAIDHLLAWKLLVFGLVHPTFAQMTLLRGALEGSVTCRWLIDPTVVADERVARGVAAALDDFMERRRFEASSGMEARPAGNSSKTAADRITELKLRRQAAGIGETRYPTTTALVEQYGGAGGEGVWLYRLVSAFAHAKQWSLAATDRETKSVRHTVHGVEAGVISASDQVVLFATVRAVELTEAAVAEYERYVREASWVRKVMGP